MAFVRQTKFVEEVLPLAESVEAFRARWDFPGVISNEQFEMRVALLTEELDEYTEAVNNGDLMHALDEVADIAYLALGCLEETGEFGVDAIRRVVEKNNAKSPETHSLHPVTGKVGKW